MNTEEPMHYAAGVDEGHLPGDELERVLVRRKSPRQLFLRVGGLMLAFALIMGYLWQGQVRFDIHPATTLPAAEAYVQLRTMVAHGKLMINDSTFPFVSGRKYPLQRGGNLLTLSGAPLAEPRWCVVYWPDPKFSAYSCLHMSFSADHRLVTADLGYSLAEADPDLLNTMANSANAQLNQAANTFNTTSFTIPVGVYYAKGIDPTTHLPLAVQASTEMDASLNIQFDNISDFSSITGCLAEPCYLASMKFAQFQIPLMTTWSAYVPRLFSAQSTDLTGTTLTFAIRYANNALQLAIPTDQPTYPSLDAYIRATMLTAICLDPARPLLKLTSNTLFAAVQTGPTGCTFRLAQVTGNGNTTGDAGSYVVRFGVVLTADATAHSLFPVLPVATAADIAAVHS